MTMNHERYSDIYAELINYYDRIQGAQDYWEATEALWELVEHAPIQLPLTYADLLESGAVPPHRVFERDPELAYDIQTVLPLAVIGPYLDRSPYDIRNTGEWYDAAVREVQRAAMSRHRPACLEQKSVTNCHCDYSVFCPLRYLEMALGDQATLFDFDDPAYEQDPMRADLVMAVKLAVGRDTGVLTESFCREQLRYYQLRIDAHTSDGPQDNDA